MTKWFRKWKYWLPLFAVVALATASAAQATGGHGNGDGHTPITVCHKPGTPAEQELTFDDNALGQVFVNAHLGHGDTLGPCAPPPPPDVCPNIEGLQSSVPDGLVKNENGDCVPPTPDPGQCPEGYEQTGSDPILCLKTVTEIVTVEKEVPGPERVVYVNVPGPERVVVEERRIEVPVEKIVEVPVTVTKTVTKIKKVPVVKVKKVVKWKTKTKIVKVSGSTSKCVCPSGYRLWKGKCYPIVRGNG